MEKITAQQAAEKWGIALRRVQDHCKKGRIPGAQLFGHNWMIPADAVCPLDGRSKAGKAAKLNPADNRPLVRKSPFLDMTDLYNAPGTADEAAKSLDWHPEAQALFRAEIAYSRGEIDRVYEHARYFLEKHSGFYAVLSGGMLLALVAMWKGDIHLWNEAHKHFFEAPCKDDIDRDIVALALASTDSAIRSTKGFPEWFSRGCFDNLPRDAHPAARVYYIKHLLINAQELALGNIEIEGFSGLTLMKTLPYMIEPMISQMVVDKVVLAEAYLRLLISIAYHQCGNDKLAAEHCDKAIRLCLADGLYGPLCEHRRQLGTFLDDRLALIDPDALRMVMALHKQLHEGWTKLHNAVLDKTVKVSLAEREREVARLASFGMTDQQIAKQLYLSVTSVKSALRSAKNKCGVVSRDELGLFI